MGYQRGFGSFPSLLSSLGFSSLLHYVFASLFSALTALIKLLTT